MNPLVLTVEQAAEYLSCTTFQLQRWRTHGGGPAFIPWGKRSIRYRVSDLDDFVASRPACHSTAEAAVLRESA